MILRVNLFCLSRQKSEIFSISLINFVKLKKNFSSFKQFLLPIEKCRHFKGTLYVPWIALFSGNRWRLDVLTFLIKGFGYCFVPIDLG